MSISPHPSDEENRAFVMWLTERFETEPHQKSSATTVLQIGNSNFGIAVHDYKHASLSYRALNSLAPNLWFDADHIIRNPLSDADSLTIAEKLQLYDIHKTAIYKASRTEGDLRHIVILTTIVTYNLR